MPRETPRKRQVYTDDDIVGRAPWAPVLDEEVWRSVVAKLTDPERRTNHADPAVRWLGSSIYQCPCGSGLRVNKSSEHAAWPIYRCQQGDREKPWDVSQRRRAAGHPSRSGEFDGHLLCSQAHLVGSRRDFY